MIERYQCQFLRFVKPFLYFHSVRSSSLFWIYIHTWRIYYTLGDDEFSWSLTFWTEKLHERTVFCRRITYQVYNCKPRYWETSFQFSARFFIQTVWNWPSWSRFPLFVFFLKTIVCARSVCSSIAETITTDLSCPTCGIYGSVLHSDVFFEAGSMISLHSAGRRLFINRWWFK